MLFPLFSLAAAVIQTAVVLPRDDSTYSNESTNSNYTTTSATPTSSISVNPVLPAGGVNLQSPASTTTTYVKSGATVSFQWNYTSLILSPPAINIDVICTANSQTYKLARNQSIETQSVVWDTGNAGDDGNLHLISDKYTLVVYNAEKAATDVASAGELAAFSYVFGVYIPQSYEAWPQGAKYVNEAAKPLPKWPLLALIALI